MKKNEILLRVVECLLDENKRLRQELAKSKPNGAQFDCAFMDEANHLWSDFFNGITAEPKVKVKVEPRFAKGGVIHDSGNEPIINKGEEVVPDSPELIKFHTDTDCVTKTIPILFRFLGQDKREVLMYSNRVPKIMERIEVDGALYFVSDSFARGENNVNLCIEKVR